MSLNQEPVPPPGVKWVIDITGKDDPYFQEGYVHAEAWYPTQLFCPNCGNRSVVVGGRFYSEIDGVPHRPGKGAGELCLSCGKIFRYVDQDWIRISIPEQLQNHAERLEFLRANLSEALE